MKILVSGCARSGTTMMIHLMEYFYCCNVITEDEMHPYNFLQYNDSDHALVIKKPYIDGVNVQKFSIRGLIKLGWKIIWMLRDGRDVVCSQVDGSYWCDPDRWIEANMELLANIDHRSLLVVRYEDLCRDTKSQMDAISRFIGLGYQESFGDWYMNIDPEKPMDKGMRKEPTLANTGAYINHVERIKQAMINQEFKTLLNIFGYGR